MMNASRLPEPVVCNYTGQNDIIGQTFDFISRCPREALRSIATCSSLRILFFSKRPEFFDFTDLLEPSGGGVDMVQGFASERELLACSDRFDVAIVCNSLMSEHTAHLIIRQRKLAEVVVAWTLDNHHHPAWNRTMVAFSDLVLLGHAFADDVFASADTLVGRSFALTTGQWTRSLARERTNVLTRSDAMFGGFVAWGLGTRDRVIRDLITKYPGSALRLIEPTERGSYFDQSPAQRFDEWSAYKTHLAFPLLKDLSCRVFDSLLCGQVPLVPHECPDLDQIVPRAEQDSLPILRFYGEDMDSIVTAHGSAIARFDEDGVAGIVRRRDYASNNHHIAVRIGEIARYLHAAAREGAISTLTCDDVSVRWRLDDPKSAKRASVS